MTKIGLLGGGSWATAIAKILLKNSKQHINWWMRDANLRRSILENGVNDKYLSSATIDKERITMCEDATSLVEHSDVVVLSLPSHAVVNVLQTIPSQLLCSKRIISTIKGLVSVKDGTMLQYLSNNHAFSSDDYCVVSGPSHAEEVAQESGTFLVAASKNKDFALSVQQIMQSEKIYVSISDDVCGIELTGVMKNIYAIGIGIVCGLGYGSNFKSAIVSAASRELEHLLDTCIPNPNRCFSSPAYLGDLIVTCYSSHSRNYRFGEYVGQGASVEQALTSVEQTVEGYNAIYGLQKWLTEEQMKSLPLANMVYQVVHRHASLQEQIQKLIATIK